VSRNTVRRSIVILALAGSTLRCGSDLTVPSDALPSFIVIEAGNGQSGEVGTPLGEALVVRVTDAKGRPAQDVPLAFVPLNGAAGSGSGSDTARTGPDGRASWQWILGVQAGTATLEARVSGAGTVVLKVPFTATAVAGAAHTILAVRGDGQTAAVGAVLADSLVARVTDRYGNPVAGQTIRWQAGDGGGVSDSETVTGADGEGRVAWRLGSGSGSQSAQAAVGGLTGSPLTFTATASPGLPASVRKTSGDGQTAPAGTRLASPIVAQVVDEYGNGLPGQRVNWIITAGGGTTNPTTGTTDATGHTSTEWTLGPSAGPQGLSAVSAGLPPAPFSAMAVPQVPANLEAVSSTSLAGIAGQPLTPPPATRVTDALGNPVPGVAVMFSVRGTGGTVSSGAGAATSVTVSTDFAGLAALTSWTLGAAVGGDTVDATASGPTGPLSGSPILFTAFGLSGSATRLHFLQEPTNTAAGQPITPPVTVAVQDSNGNLVSNFTGTITISLGTFPPGGTLTGTTAATAIGGVATFSGLLLSTLGSGYTLVASAGPTITTATSTAFSVTPGGGLLLAIVTQPYDTALSGVPFPRQPVVRLQDGFGNPVAQAGVAVTAVIGSGGGTLLGTASVSTATTGVATFTDLAISGVVGSRTLTFTAAGSQSATSTPIVLLPGAAATMALAAGGDQTATIGTTVAIPPAVRVTDLGGNPVQGITVTFAVTLGGGSVTAPSPVTGPDGIAAVGAWRLGPIKGPNALTATATGLGGSPLIIAATGRFAYQQVRGGAEFSCGLSTAGTPYCWGRNDKGQVGNGGTQDQPAPVAVAGGLVLQTIGMGDTHACGLTTTGAAYCWGVNGNGQLGDGSTSNRLTPVQVAGGLTFVSIEGGDAHTCALTASGTAYCWGQNNSGQLGDGTTTARLTPTAVTGGLTFTSLALGTAFTCGRSTAGIVYCWGVNKNGQLGNGTKANKSVPTATAGSGWTAVTAGQEFACALSAAGTAACWGRNDKGQLGNGAKPDLSTPTSVAGALAFSQVRAGQKHACGLTTAGAAYCWGLNADGELGDGTTTDRSTPTAVTGGQVFAGLGLGGLHSLAVTPLGAAFGWGRGQNGQLGTGTTTGKQPTPTPVLEP
jgi:alpha-tubulin suppressor-like RCC1 family protein